jgi:hypothetical protein
MAAKVLVEYVTLAGAASAAEPQLLETSAGTPETLVDIEDVAILTAGAPSWGVQSGNVINRGFARVTVLEGAVKMAWGKGTPNPADGVRAAADQLAVHLSLREGDVIAFVESEEPPAAVGGSGATAALQTAANTRLGNVNDTAYAGVGDKGIIGILKGLWDALMSPTTSIPPRAGDTTRALTRTPINIAGADSDPVLAADATHRHHIARLVLNIPTATVLTFENDGGDCALPVAAGLLVLDYCEHPWFSTAINTAWTIGKSIDSNLIGWVDSYKGPN